MNEFAYVKKSPNQDTGMNVMQKQICIWFDMEPEE